MNFLRKNPLSLIGAVYPAKKKAKPTDTLSIRQSKQNKALKKTK